MQKCKKIIFLKYFSLLRFFTLNIYESKKKYRQKISKFFLIVLCSFFKKKTKNITNLIGGDIC